MAVRKLGIIVRLGNLIVVQVLFIFAALALILFVPESDQELGRRLASLENELHELEQLAVGWYGAEHRPVDSPGVSFEGLTSLFDSLHSVDRAAVLRLIDGDRIEVAFAYRSDWAADEEILPDQDVSGFCNYDMLRLMAASDNLFSPDRAVGPEHLVSYRRLDGGRGEPVVLVLALTHGLSVSNLSNLKYAVLVLFLCSALVSLLTVSLLLRKFKQPLDHIIAGLEETAEGKLHNLTELENDPQLGKLVRAYNSMTRRLWDNRHELDGYFTRLQQANVELRESQSFLTTLIDRSPLAIVVTDAKGNIIMFNRAAGDTFGHNTEEAVGEPIDLLLADRAERESLFNSPSKHEGVEVRCRRRDGETFPAYVITGLIEAEPDGLTARLFVCQDITDNKNFQDMMIRLDRYYTRGEMAGDIAHEINNYLAVLLGNVELMPLFLKKGKMDKVEQKLEVMKTALEKIARFSDGLLDSPHDNVRLEPASINQIIEVAIGFLQPQNKFDAVDLSTELSNEIPVLQVDTGQVQQLLVNLIYNAAEALADVEAPRTLKVITSVEEFEGEPGVRITVRDSGPGVVPDKVPLLFNTRFTTKRGGHGIGLITCRKIVDNHDGDIQYRFENGAVFSVLLPVRVQEPDEADPVAESSYGMA